MSAMIRLIWNYRRVLLDIFDLLYVIPLIFYRVTPSWYHVILLFLESLFVESLKRMQRQINFDADNIINVGSETL